MIWQKICMVSIFSKLELVKKNRLGTMSTHFCNGVWLSLVERYVRDVEVASSNLVTPTI